MVVVVVGGGLAGSEAAWQVAREGVAVTLYEMRPAKMTPAHRTPLFAELVCSNSLGSNLLDRALGLLKAELQELGSLVIQCADETMVPAGGALAVDREAFSQAVTARVSAHPRIQVQREEVTAIPQTGPVIIATGPLTSEPLARAIADLVGQEHLYFYDAMAPIVEGDTVDMTIAFRSSRYGRGSDDYINCPLSKDEYDRFVDALVRAEQMLLRSFEEEDPKFFEACLPVEEIARRGHEALAFGPMRPVGLTDPRSGRRPYAVVQLRQDNLAGTLYNMVGFQTNLRWGEQDRVFRLIPGLARARFVRYGQMHRNMFLNGPMVLHPTMQSKVRGDLFFAGQITGTEGYVGSVASGLVAGVNAARLVRGEDPLVFPPETMVGALMRYVAQASPAGFQPMKANFGLLPPLQEGVRGKRRRGEAHAVRALACLKEWRAGVFV
ncbi:MAG: FADH(2)-oxidizing methylenetetrahydrofolate--tRNA-(uracil(54)-C(5))-methyltransferase TrmFO [Anaerolineae bacterium]